MRALILTAVVGTAALLAPSAAQAHGGRVYYPAPAGYYAGYVAPGYSFSYYGPRVSVGFSVGVPVYRPAYVPVAPVYYPPAYYPPTYCPPPVTTYYAPTYVPRVYIGY
jgi:hypothetical protein